MVGLKWGFKGITIDDIIDTRLASAIPLRTGLQTTHIPIIKPW